MMPRRHRRNKQATKAGARAGSLRPPDSINVARGNVSTQSGARVRSVLAANNDGARL